ncbi:MAG: proline--tRNA ligase [Candidatus Micrarchaeia archaeon]
MSEKIETKGITTKKENLGEWYSEVLTKSEFLDYSDVSGCYIYRPAANFVWEIIRDATNEEFKKIGIQNVYFPLFIPERYLKKEEEHFAGFKAEVAWVTHGGDSELDERLAVRPTSETIMYVSYSKWIRSWRDLPLRYNQWNNVVRWEFKHPMPFIRGREFLWNEGHDVFATKEEAEAERDIILSIYQKILKDYLALPYIAGRKSEKEKFAGAVASYSLEMLMPDGLAIQGPDFHHDGTNFSKSFDIKFIDKDEQTKYAYQNTYAITTRVIGVMVATHSDEKGLVIPPKLALVQIVIVPILGKDDDIILKKAEELKEELSKHYRVKLDDREGYTPGYKFNEWELKGVPIRIEIGPKDIKNNSVVIARRDNFKKYNVGIDKLLDTIKEMLDEMHNDLYKKAEQFLNEHTTVVSNYDEFKKTLASKLGFIHTPWCGETECEDHIKEETGAKITNIPFDQSKLKGKCVYCGKDAKYMANFAKSY